jgi:hypothetical protein
MKITRYVISVFLIVLTFSSLAKKVEINTAMLAGKNFYYERVNLHQSVPYNSIVLKFESTADDNGIAQFYIFNVNSNGFVIVSADDACTPVLGYSFNNVYTGNDKPDGLISLLEAYRNEVRLVKTLNLEADNAIRSDWEKYSSPDFPSLKNLLSPLNTADVQPLLPCTWDQTFPYNAMCPKDPASPGGYSGRVPVGCVATAMSQLMYYWRWPNQGEGVRCYTPSGYPQQCAYFDTTIYDWNGMNNITSYECNPMALISWHAGVAVNMQYGPNGSGAQTSLVPGRMSQYFRFSNAAHFAARTQYPGNQWHDSLQSNLDKGHPVIYDGFNPSEGHCFVFDGYQTGNYYHVNWGWSGSYNGYFLITNLNPGGTTFNNDQGAVFTEVPDPAQYPVYCQGNTNVVTYDFGSIEDGSGPVLDYQNDASCTWLIAPNDSVSTVSLTFDNFNLASGDVLSIYDGSSTSATLIGTYTGSALPPAANSTGPSMFIAFTTNSSSTAPGFLAHYNSTLIDFCSQSAITLTDPDGSFTDGSGQRQYRNNINCKWRIVPDPPSGSISVSFPVMNTEQNYDVVTIYDMQTGNMLGQFSGNPTQAPSVTANTTGLFIMFTTSNSIRGEGWSASYSSTVGMDEKSGFTSVQVYPNPAAGLINIDFTPDHTSAIDYELLNLQGITVFSGKTSGRSGNVHEVINVSSLPKGIYLLKISSETGVLNKKIVLN